MTFGLKFAKFFGFYPESEVGSENVCVPVGTNPVRVTHVTAGHRTMSDMKELHRG